MRFFVVVLLAATSTLASAVLPANLIKDALRSPQLDVSPALGSGGAFAGFDPSWDGRREISDFNRFMDTIFRRMNAAIAQRHLDPMDLEILPKMIKEYKTKNKSKRPRVDPDTPDHQDFGRKKNFQEVKAMLHGMSSLNRTGDVSIFFHPGTGERTVQCPFSLGPLELVVSKSVEISKKVRRRSAKAVTELMLGLMDVKVVTRTNAEDEERGTSGSSAASAEITDVVFDEPGGVDVQGSLKRRANTKDDAEQPYRLTMAADAALSLKKVAHEVAATSGTISIDHST